MVEGVETESKHRVRDAPAVLDALERLGFHAAGVRVQDDEYFDTPTNLLRAGDMVVRLRRVGGTVTACFKGPRTYLPDGSYSRIEIEMPAGGLAEVRAALSAQSLRCVWRLQKRRSEFRHPEQAILVCLDEVPRLGQFVELEGEPPDIAWLTAALGSAIEPPERLNYRELAARHLRMQGNTLRFAGG